MTRYAILLGSASEDFRQKKIEDMFNFLNSKKNASDSIVTFANGISELMLEMVLNNSVKQLADTMVEPAVTELHRSIENTSKARTNSILLYICTNFPVKDRDRSFWLGGEEIRRDVIEHYQTLINELGIDMQVVMDFDSEMVSEESMGWEKVENV